MPGSVSSCGLRGGVEVDRGARRRAGCPALAAADRRRPTPGSACPTLATRTRSPSTSLAARFSRSRSASGCAPPAASIASMTRRVRRRARPPRRARPRRPRARRSGSRQLPRVVAVCGRRRSAAPVVAVLSRAVGGARRRHSAPRRRRPSPPPMPIRYHTTPATTATTTSDHDPDPDARRAQSPERDHARTSRSCSPTANAGRGGTSRRVARLAAATGARVARPGAPRTPAQGSSRRGGIRPSSLRRSRSPQYARRRGSRGAGTATGGSSERGRPSAPHRGTPGTRRP